MTPLALAENRSLAEILVDKSKGRTGVSHVRSNEARYAAATLAIWLGSVIGFAPDAASTTKTFLLAACAMAVQVGVALRAHDSRFSGTRAMQSSQVWIGAFAGFVAALVVGRLLAIDVSIVGVLVAAFGSGLLFAIRQELGALRGLSTRTQRSVIVGTGEEAAEWIDLVKDHPELKLEVVGCIGDPTSASRVGIADHWLGPIDDLETLLETERIDVPIVAVTSFRRPALQEVVKRLLATERDVAMSWGVGRLSGGRLATRTLSHETLPVIRVHRPGRLSLRAKRLSDIVLAAMLLTVTAPIVLAAAVLVRLDSQGPSFFRQRRVGLESEPFEIIKLRTMTRDAESKVDQLADDNERNGPLFKLSSDPRVTRIGKFLRATSIDEIPQLVNVLRGEMSLVGPRPALPTESEQFDDELCARASVRPGITGLWQLEARANESFRAYKRLDLHYIENWSLGLDLRIAIATAQLLVLGTLVAPLARYLQGSQPSRHEKTPQPAVARTQEVSVDSQPKTHAERIAVLGAGYVGLTQALGLTDLGHQVVCADIDKTRVAELQAGIPPILEDGLEQLLAKSNASGRLEFTDDPVGAVKDADYIFLCVATPQRDDGAADLCYLEAAAKNIGPALRPGAVVVNKSTVPVGSTDLVANELGRDDVFVVSNPEFLREGTSIADWQNPDRIVVGGDAEAAQRVLGLYAALPGKRIACDAPSAELIKYASNAYLATRLTFVNSMSQVCEALGADVTQVTSAMGLDTRIGSRYLEPGPGWGGSCLPKDTRALAYQADQTGVGFAQLRATIDANGAHLDHATQTILDALPGDPRTATVGALGIAFKAGTGDTRESPAVKIIERLHAAGVTVRAYDPGVMESPVEGVVIANSSVDCARGADVLAVLTEWPEFQDLDLKKVAEVMNTKSVVDLRNHLSGNDVVRHGFEYKSLGRGTVVPTRADA